ncbi:MAG: sporulation integral membrane protein YtvI [Clostridia bacterium]
MGDTIARRLAAWNDRMNGLPRKGMLIALTIVLAALAVLLLPYCWPFLLALLFSLMLEPFVRLITVRCARLRVGRGLATCVGMLLFFGVAGVLVALLVGRLGQELRSLLGGLPQVIAWVKDVAFPYAKGLYAQYQGILPGYLLELFNNTLSALGDSLVRLAGTLSAMLTSGAWSTATSIPNVLLSIVLTVMGTYYLTADQARILGYFNRTFPKSVRTRGRAIKADLLKALFGQLKSQVTVSLIIVAFLSVSFEIFGVHYGLLLGFIIGIADALPVVGAGLFLIPWSILSFIAGDYAMGIFMACMYVGTIVIRQVVEPRIVGHNLGLYPLATMIAMYAGYRALGFLGLLAGPVLLNILKVVLEADETARGKRNETEEPGIPARDSVSANSK